MVVAYYMPHNDGIETGILDKPGMDTGLDLVDLYEVDGQIATFETAADAEIWLNTQKARRS
ncbi:MAG TPA: hypothetical protein VNS88_09725 [Nitrospiraceae bacterium]|nr:hypothetical protein [Nitrospiraceae bacterium]